MDLSKPVNVRHIAELINKDNRTVKSCLVGQGIDVNGGSIYLIDVFEYLYELHKQNDKRKSTNKNNKTEAIEITSDEAPELYGELHLGDPTKFKEIQVGAIKALEREEYEKKLISREYFTQMLYTFSNLVVVALSNFEAIVQNDFDNVDLLNRLEDVIDTYKLATYNELTKVIKELSAGNYDAET